MPGETCAAGFRLDDTKLCQPCVDPLCTACDASADRCTMCGPFGQQPEPQAGPEEWAAYAENATGVDRTTGAW